MKIWNRLSYGLLGGLGAVVLLFASSMANALTSCDAATSKDEPCLAGDLGTLTFVTTGKKQGNQFEYVIDNNESIQSIGTQGGSCEIITDESLVSFSETAGFSSTLGDISSGQLCGLVEDSMAWRFDGSLANAVSVESTVDVEAKGKSIQGKFELYIGSDLQATIMFRGGDLLYEPGVDGVPPSGNDVAEVYDAQSVTCAAGSCASAPMEPLTLSNGEVEEGPFIRYANLQIVNEAGPDKGFFDHALMSFKFPFNEMKITMTTGSVGIDGGQAGGFVSGGSVFNLAQFFDGVLDCGDKVTATGDGGSSATFIRLPNDQINGTCANFCNELLPYSLTWAGNEVTFDADTGNDQECAAFKWEIETAVRPVVQPAVAQEVGDGFDNTATSLSGGVEASQKFKFELDPEYWIDLCPLGKVFTTVDNGSPAYPNLPNEITKNIGGVEVGIEAMCFKDGDGNCIPGPLTDMSPSSAAPGTQFACYTQAEVIYDPDGTGEEDKFLTRFVGWLLGDWRFKY